MAFCNSQHYAPFETSIEHEVSYDIAKLPVSLLKEVAGFKKNAKSAAWEPESPMAVTRLFGAETTRGGFNPLLRIGYFPARKVSEHALASTAPSPITDPHGATMRMIYAHADSEIGSGDAQDDNGLMKPEWVLRRLSFEDGQWRLARAQRKEQGQTGLAGAWRCQRRYEERLYDHNSSGQAAR